MSTFISKAFKTLAGTVQKASRGTLSSYIINAPHQYGQPSEMVAVADVQGLITPERKREIVMKTPTAAASLNAILDYSSGVQIKLRNVDPSKPADPAKAKLVDNFMRRPNSQDTWGRFRYKIERDMATLGFGAAEIEWDENHRPANLWPLDAGRLKIDFDEHGEILGYNMLDARGVPITKNGKPWAFTPEDVIFFPRDPVSHSLYPTARIDQLFTCAVLEDMMISFIGGRFTDSNIPYGLLDLGEITDQELESAVAQWNAQVRKDHKIMLTGSKGGSKWYPFAYALKELEAPQLLAEVRGKIMAVLGVTMNELGESQDINKSNGYNLSFTFKKRAIEPMLDVEVSVLTRCFLWDALGFTDLEFYYEEIDSRDELLQAQIDEIYFKMGVFSVNHMLNRKGFPSVPGGDVRTVFTGSAFIPVNMIQPFAQAQLNALMMVEYQAAGDPGSSNISPPITRPPKFPEGFTTPDGSGSSSVKIRYPKPQSPVPQKPRGPVHQLRAQGLRKEDTA